MVDDRSAQDLNAGATRAPDTKPAHDTAVGERSAARARAYLKVDKRNEAIFELAALIAEHHLDHLDRQLTQASARNSRAEADRLILTTDEAYKEFGLIVGQLFAICGKIEESVQARASTNAVSADRAFRAPLAAVSPSDSGSRRSRAVNCVDVKKHYGRGFTLGPVSFTLDRGEILGVIGRNGSGKTSLLRIIAGELAPDSGTCEVSARDSHDRLLAVPVMVVPESPPEWSGRMEEHLAWQAAVFGYRGVAENKRRVKYVMRHLHIEGHEHKSWTELSDGLRMRCAIAATLLANPGLIVLDEPLGPLDPRSQQDLLRWMRYYAERNQIGFVISTQDVTGIEAVADKVLALIPGTDCRAFQHSDEARTLGTMFILELLPGTPRAQLVRFLESMGTAMAVVEWPSFVLVRTSPAASLNLDQLAQSTAGMGVIAIRDLSRSHLRTLLEEPQP